MLYAGKDIGIAKFKEVLDVSEVVCREGSRRVAGSGRVKQDRGRDGSRKCVGRTGHFQW